MFPKQHKLVMNVSCDKITHILPKLSFYLFILLRKQ